MARMANDTRPPLLPYDWINVSFIGLTHLLAAVGTTGYLWLHGMTLTAAVLFLVWSGATIFSISAGYHRLFSHVTFDAHPALRLFLLICGAAAFQNSALKWATDHRRHHKRVDTDQDPYNINEGFWHAHIGWVLRKESPTVSSPSVADLQRDRLVMWQHRNYALIAFSAGLILPALVGLLMGDFWGGFIVAGLLRIVVLHHVTFSINSFAHWLGTQPYSDESTARDSFVTALISMGEGYHNFHHTFPLDYRNGVGIYQYDPTKWLLRGMSTVGLTSNLRRTPQWLILQARMDMDERRLQQRLGGAPLPPALSQRLASIRLLMNERIQRFRALKARREALRAERDASRREHLNALRAEIRAARREIVRTFGLWKNAARLPPGVVAV